MLLLKIRRSFWILPDALHILTSSPAGLLNCPYRHTRTEVLPFPSKLEGELKLSDLSVTTVRHQTTWWNLQLPADALRMAWAPPWALRLAILTSCFTEPMCTWAWSPCCARPCGQTLPSSQVRRLPRRLWNAWRLPIQLQRLTGALFVLSSSMTLMLPLQFAATIEVGRLAAFPTGEASSSVFDRFWRRYENWH